MLQNRSLPQFLLHLKPGRPRPSIVRPKCNRAVRLLRHANSNRCVPMSRNIGQEAIATASQDVNETGNVLFWVLRLHRGTGSILPIRRPSLRLGQDQGRGIRPIPRPTWWQVTRDRCAGRNVQFHGQNGFGAGSAMLIPGTCLVKAVERGLATDLPAFFNLRYVE